MLLIAGLSACNNNADNTSKTSDSAAVKTDSMHEHNEVSSVNASAPVDKTSTLAPTSGEAVHT